MAAEPVTAATNVPDRAQSELSLKSEPPVQLASAAVTAATNVTVSCGVGSIDGDGAVDGGPHMPS